MSPLAADCRRTSTSDEALVEMNQMNSRISGILFVAAVALLSPVSVTVAAEGDCRADLARLCPELEPQDAEAKNCLKENLQDLSPGCKDNIRKLIGALQSFAEACGQDVKTLCPEVVPGGGRILRCLKKNKESVSAGCTGFLTK